MTVYLVNNEDPSHLKAISETELRSIGRKRLEEEDKQLPVMPDKLEDKDEQLKAALEGYEEQGYEYFMTESAAREYMQFRSQHPATGSPVLTRFDGRKYPTNKAPLFNSTYRR